MTALKWIREGDPIPDGHRLLQVLMRELRPTGSGTATDEWILCELEVLNQRKSVKL